MRKNKNENLKQLTLREFDKTAETFDNNDPSVYNLCRKDYPDVLKELQNENFTDLLDAGCGTGAMLYLFSRDIPGKRYVGLDLSEKMIAVAKQKQITGVKFLVGDCEELPFEDASFDVVTCSMSFHHYPDPDKFFVNLKKVLRLNGRFILRDMTSGSKLNLWFINNIELPFLRTFAKKGDVHCYSKEDIQKLCDKSGLVMEKFEVRKGFRLHCVIRNKQ